VPSAVPLPLRAVSPAVSRTQSWRMRPLLSLNLRLSGTRHPQRKPAASPAPAPTLWAAQKAKSDASGAVIKMNLDFTWGELDHRAWGDTTGAQSGWSTRGSWQLLAYCGYVNDIERSLSSSCAFVTPALSGAGPGAFKCKQNAPASAPGRSLPLAHFLGLALKSLVNFR
jgi:hypothetical protein